MALIDVSKWFDVTKKIDVVEMPVWRISVELNFSNVGKYSFRVFLSNGMIEKDVESKAYDKKLDCEYEMEMFCKKIQGENL